MNRKQDLGKEIKARREELGLTQAQLAYRLRCSLNTVARWEQGRRAPSKWIWPKVRRILRLTEGRSLRSPR